MTTVEMAAQALIWAAVIATLVYLDRVWSRK